MKKNNPGFHPWNVSTRISHGATFRTLQLFVRPHRHPRSSHCRRASELNMLLGQIITTSAEVTPNGGLVGIILICPEFLGPQVFSGKTWRVFSTKKTTLGTPDSGFKDQGIPPKCRNNLGLGFIEYFLAGGSFKYFWNFRPENWGWYFQLDSDFSKGLKPPPRRCMVVPY